MAKQLSRPGAQVTRSSSGSGLGVDTGHWTKLTGWQRSRGSRRQSCPSEPRLAMLGPGPRPPASAHHLPPADPELGLRFSDGVHFWRVSTSPRRPEVQQKAKVSASRTCRLLSNSPSLTPGWRGERRKVAAVRWVQRFGGVGWSKPPPLGSSPLAPGRANHFLPPSHLTRSAWLIVCWSRTAFPSPGTGAPEAWPCLSLISFPQQLAHRVGFGFQRGWVGLEEPARGCGT